MEGLSESLRYELSLHNILVKLVEPGHFKTGFIRSIGMLNHPAYETQFANYMRWVLNEDDAAPGPKPVAKVIFQAANDASPRLRYMVNGRMILALSRIVPDAIWRSLLGGGMTRQPKRSK